MSSEAKAEFSHLFNQHDEISHKILEDPLSPETRRSRKSLLIASTICAAVGLSNLIPRKLEAFGLSFEEMEHEGLVIVGICIIIYLTSTFVIYAWTDVIRYTRLFAQRERCRARLARFYMHYDLETLEDLSGDSELRNHHTLIISTSTSASLLRITIEFGVPVIVAVAAFWFLWTVEITRPGDVESSTREGALLFTLDSASKAS